MICAASIRAVTKLVVGLMIMSFRTTSVGNSGYFLEVRAQIKVVRLAVASVALFRHLQERERRLYQTGEGRKEERAETRTPMFALLDKVNSGSSVCLSV